MILKEQNKLGFVEYLSYVKDLKPEEFLGKSEEEQSQIKREYMNYTLNTSGIIKEESR